MSLNFAGIGEYIGFSTNIKVRNCLTNWKLVCIK